jgi:pimeloyl-ACP methyl ester carboxylesterase
MSSSVPTPATVSTAAGDFEVTSHGSGPDALFLHGGPELSDYLEDLADLLAPVVRSHRYTQRGVAPAPLEGPFTVAQHVDDAVAISDALELDRPVLIGHSWGGFLAASVAAAHPGRFSGIVSIDGLGVVKDGGMAAFGAHFVNSADGAARERMEELSRIEDDERPLTEAEENEQFELSWPYYFADPANAPPVPDWDSNTPAMQQVFADITEMLTSGSLAEGLAGCPMPALFLGGEKSGFPAWVFSESAAAMPAGQSKLLPGAGHFTWHERPGPTSEAIAEFVAGLQPAGT